MNAEKTQWIDGSIKPSRPGVYEAEFGAGYTSFFNFSAGGRWSVGAGTPDEAAENSDGYSNRPIHWRGLAQDPSAATPEPDQLPTLPPGENFECVAAPELLEADPTKLQPGKPTSLSMTSGKYLDALAATSGIKRKRWLLVFKESDGALRARIRRSLFRGWVGVAE